MYMSVLATFNQLCFAFFCWLLMPPFRAGTGAFSRRNWRLFAPVSWRPRAGKLAPSRRKDGALDSRAPPEMYPG